MIEVKSESSGAFVPTFISPTATISVGASGSIITLTPPSGERARLTSLVSNRTDNIVTVSVGGVNIISSKALGRDSANTNLFIIASGGSQFYLNSSNGLIREIMGGVDEQIIVIRSGLTTANIRYAYQFGVIK